MRNFIISLAANIAFFLIGFFMHKLLVKWSLRHLKYFIGKAKKMRIVIPSFSVPEFEISGVEGKATIPSNVAVMPMAEGRGIAELVKGFQSRFSNVDIEFVSQVTFEDNGSPFISIGGPSVNSVSGRIFEKYCPLFALKYPEHIASYGSVIYNPEFGPDHSLREDFGFILHTKSPKGSPCLVLCGVWAPGTHVAIQALLWPQNNLLLSGMYKDLKIGKPFFAISHGTIDGLQITAEVPSTVHTL